MALSKPVQVNDVEFYKDLKNWKININEVHGYTAFPVDDAVSISVIHGYLGGPDNRYYAWNADNSLECYAVNRDELLDKIEKGPGPFIFFEELQSFVIFFVLSSIRRRRRSEGAFIAIFNSTDDPSNHPKSWQLPHFDLKNYN